MTYTWSGNVQFKGGTTGSYITGIAPAGGQYASEDYQRALAARGIQCGMSRMTLLST